MSGPSDRHFDLNLGEEAAPPSPDNIWRPSFISPTGQILLDHQRFVGLFQQHLPSSSGAVPRNKASNDQPLMPTPSGAPPTAEASPTTETSPKQPL